MEQSIKWMTIHANIIIQALSRYNADFFAYDFEI